MRDAVQVAGPKVDDAELRAELDKKVHNRKIEIAVHNGQIALRSGRVDPLSADAAVHAVAETPGVLSVANHMDVIPWGPGPGGAMYSISSLP
jgi:osmotically-inducible protein OsmY